MPLYHVDRNARLWEGGEVGPSDDVAWGSPSETSAAFASVFPRGVAPRGQTYLELPFQQLGHHDLVHFMAELLFEMVRRERYPHLPSRWEGTFGVRDLEQARHISLPMKHQGHPALIWELESDEVFELDYSHLTKNLGRSLLEALGAAERHWRGEHVSPDPGDWHVLLRPPVRVVRQVEEDELLRAARRCTEGWCSAGAAVARPENRAQRRLAERAARRPAGRR